MELEGKPAPELKSVGKGKVAITCDVENSELFIDGKFMGNTPATISLASGAHKVEVRGTDGKKWERELEVLADSELKLNATLR